MSILKQQVNSCSNFASFFIVMTQSSSVSFKLIHFLLWIKGSYQSPSSETFKCSGEKLPYSSCHLLNYRSVFLQILHQSSVSWKITRLYIFRSNVIYLAQKEPVKVEILTISSAQVKIHEFLSFLKQISFPSNFSSEELSLMTLKCDEKFKEKRTCGLKYDMRNLVDFHPTTQKSENFFLMCSFCRNHIRF